MGTAEDLAFLLSDSGTAHVDASDVLHVVDKSLREKNKLMPRGMTEADAWMARHGNPLASTEAALLLAHMAGKVDGMAIELLTDMGVTVTVNYFKASGTAKCDSLPIAICAAVMDSIAKREAINV